jgi:hypothetical protein
LGLLGGLGDKTTTRGGAMLKDPAGNTLSVLKEG